MESGANVWMGWGMGRIDARIQELGLVLPEPWSPLGQFLPWQRQGSTVYLAGQVNEWNGEITCHGPVGDGGVGLEAARAAARVCALNLLYTLRLACEGDLDRVDRVLRLGGFVNSVPGFAQSPLVIDAATALFIELFGEAGRHARTAVGVAGLPGNAAVEVDAIVCLRD